MLHLKGNISIESSRTLFTIKSNKVSPTKNEIKKFGRRRKNHADMCSR